MMKKMSRILALVLMLVMVFSLTACGGSTTSAETKTETKTETSTETSTETKTESTERVAPKTPTIVRVAAGPVGGTQNTFYNTVADYVGKALPGFYNFMIEASTGSAENMRLLAAGEVDFGTTGLDQSKYVNEGTNGYEGLPTDQVRQVYVIAGTGAVTHVVTSADSGIKTIEDLKGKKVAATAGVMQAYFEDILWAHDMTLDDLGTFTNLSLADMITALQDGTIDALSYGNTFPNVNFTDLAMSYDIEIIDIGEEYVNKLIEKKPWYHQEIIPAGTYKGVDHDVYSFSQYSTLQCRKDLPDDVVYDMLATTYASADKLVSLHPNYINYGDVNELTRGNVVPYHPGAAKFYAEHGITVPTE